MDQMEQAQVMKGLARPETNFEITSISGEKMNFRIIHWKPTTVFARIPLVGKYFAVPMSMLVGTKPEEVDFAEAVPAALLQLFNTMEENNLVSFIGTLLDGVYYNNMSVSENFDTVFMDKSDVVIQLITKVVEINYGPFFKTGFANLMTSLMPVVNLGKA